MTKEELNVRVNNLLGIINAANDEIRSCVNEYIESLPYKVGDKVSCSRCDICWIVSIAPERYNRIYPCKPDIFAKTYEEVTE